MKINLSHRFKRSYKKLPSNIKDDFDKRIALFIDNPKNPKLKVHKLKGRLQTCLSFYVQDGYRVLFDFSENNTEDKVVNLLDIGSHDKYRNWEK
ncbi:MAG: type II toxin-antitoxin system mRNA interferase toxin, RelE/StbE family [Patescibacteria group bacterium]|nr:type II toxin-antitoxin system mRNA interferase toxin, RelE/StbE family [Patescibacteria group bacterium]